MGAAVTASDGRLRQPSDSLSVKLPRPRCVENPMPTRLPLVLENLHIAAPCSADWDEMVGDDRTRFCGKCEKNVYNLSAMTRGQAEDLVREKEGRLCVRFYRRNDGTVLTADCPVGVRRRRLRHRVWSCVAGVAASAALVLEVLTGRARADLSVGNGKKTAQGKQQVMGQESALHAVRPMMGAPPAMPPPEMGKPAPPQKDKPSPPPPAKKVVVETGEAQMLQGDIAAP
jgi:hypothetical protein